MAVTLPWLLAVIQVFGGLYLVYLGTQAFRAAVSGRALEIGRRVSRQPRSLLRTFNKALFVGLSNPKVAAFFFGLFAPIVGPAHSTGARLSVLCGVVLIDLFYHQALAIVFVVLGTSRPVKAAQRWLDAFVGMLMTAFGLRLLVEAARSR